MQLRFRHGTLEIGGATAEAKLPKPCTWDERTMCFRAPASAYAEVVLGLLRTHQPFEDLARAYPDLDAQLVVHKEPRPYQREALTAWNARLGSVGRINAICVSVLRPFIPGFDTPINPKLAAQTP